ncbi:hypothetical protein [Amycolatopsis sp. cg13]
MWFGVELSSDLVLRSPGIDVVALAPPLLRTVSIAYRRTEVRRCTS